MGRFDNPNQMLSMTVRLVATSSPLAPKVTDNGAKCSVRRCAMDAAGARVGIEIYRTGMSASRCIPTSGTYAPRSSPRPGSSQTGRPRPASAERSAIDIPSCHDPDQPALLTDHRDLVPFAEPDQFDSMLDRLIRRQE